MNNMKRVRRNDSPTQEASEVIENDIASRQQKMNRRAIRIGNDATDYYIPYIIEKEIKVPGVGRVSTNALDSLAVNAQRAGIDVSDALGLASIETKFGANPNIVLGDDPEENRAIMNASFMRNYGGIYPQFMVNNHEWFQNGWEDSKYGPKLKVASPLQQAFIMFKNGIYNSGERGHTQKVKNEGKRLMSLPIIQNWYKQFLRNKKKAQGGYLDSLQEGMESINYTY